MGNIVEKYIEEELSVRLPTHEILSTGVMPETIKMYAEFATTIKNKIDNFGAEISQRQDKMRLINEIIAEINQNTSDKNEIDLTNNASLQEKLNKAKELGVKTLDGKMKLKSSEKDRLMENLHLAADSWDKENKNQMQQMEICMKKLDQVMMMAKEIQKCENQPKRSMLAGIKGS